MQTVSFISATPGTFVVEERLLFKVLHPVIAWRVEDFPGVGDVSVRPVGVNGLFPDDAEVVLPDAKGE